MGTVLSNTMEIVEVYVVCFQSPECFIARRFKGVGPSIGFSAPTYGSETAFAGQEEIAASGAEALAQECSWRETGAPYPLRSRTVPNAQSPWPRAHQQRGTLGLGLQPSPPYPELFNQNPHALHLYAMACEEFGWADKAIAAYAESAAHVSLIEDPAREAAAYTALARQYYDCGDIDSASRAASQAMFLNLHVGDTPNWPSTGSMTSAFVRPKPNRAASPRRVWTGSPPPSATTPGQPGPFTPADRRNRSSALELVAPHALEKRRGQP